MHEADTLKIPSSTPLISLVIEQIDLLICVPAVLSEANSKYICGWGEIIRESAGFTLTESQCECASSCRGTQKQVEEICFEVLIYHVQSLLRRWTNGL